ncbi:MAG: SDR family oxidoreductase, partial [Chloroflexi bacterium]|nr:SDR family oxidoreductase [Chloroflexota bacterium]
HRKVAIVTGALGLIGKQGHCYAPGRSGRECGCFRPDEMLCREFAASLLTLSGGGDGQRSRKASDVRQRVLATFPHIDVLVNNAAINDMFESLLAAAAQSRFENYPSTCGKNCQSTSLGFSAPNPGAYPWPSKGT